MAVSSVKIHPISAGGTNPIYIDLGRNEDIANGITELQPISLDHSNKNTLKITFNNIHIRLTTGHFNYWIGVWPCYKLTYKNASNQNKTKTVSYTVKGTKQVVTLGDGTTYDTWPRQNSQKALVIKDETTWYASTLTRINATSKVSFASNTYTEEISLTNEEGKGLYKLEIDFDVYSFHIPGGTGSIDQWGCTCDDHKEIDFRTVSSGLVFWTSISAGTISIRDNGNNTFTISGKNGKGGINNALNSGTLNTTLGIEGVSFSLVDVDTNKLLDGKADEDDFSRTYRISDTYNKIGDDGVIKVTSTITNVPSQSTDETVVAKDEKVIKFYKKPNPPTSIWYVSNGKSSASDGAFEPRLKKELSWRWTGASSGNKSSSITGYKIYIYKNEVVAGESGTAFYLASPSSDADASITNEPSSNGTPGHKIETTLTSSTNLNFKFIPKDEGFVNNDKCICRVFSGTTWGDDSIHYSAGILGECILKNGAVVWIKIPNPDDPDTLEWKEGTVYAHNGSTWKEAEGVYVHNGSSWEEST